MIGISTLNKTEETNQEIPEQKITGVPGDKSKVKQVQFQSEKRFNSEGDLSLKTTSMKYKVTVKSETSDNL